MTEKHSPLWMQRWFQITLGSLLLLTVASLAVPWLLGLVYALRSVLLPLIVALGLAYIFNPVVTWMQHRLRMPRWAGTGAVMLGAFWGVLILALVLYSQGVDLINKAKDYPAQLSERMQEQSEKQQQGAKPQADEVAVKNDSAVDDAVTDQAETSTPSAEDIPTETGFLDNLRLVIEESLGQERVSELLAKAADWFSALDWGQVAQFVLSSMDIGVGVVGSAISLTSYFALSAVIIVFCFFFFSWKLDTIIAWFVPFIPAQHKNEVLGVIVQMDKSVAAFIRGRLVQALVMACVLSVGWWLAGVPSWLLLGVLSGMLNLIPFAAVVGFLVALVLAVVDSVAGGGFSIWVLIWPTFVYVLAQGLDGWVVEPIVQGKATDLDPVSVLLAVMIGGALAGLLGMLIAIPSAACIKILSREVVLPRLRKLAAGETVSG